MSLQTLTMASDFVQKRKVTDAESMYEGEEVKPGALPGVLIGTSRVWRDGRETQLLRGRSLSLLPGILQEVSTERLQQLLHLCQGRKLYSHAQDQEKLSVLSLPALYQERDEDNLGAFRGRKN